MGNVLYYPKYWYYGDSKECVQCILKTYSQYYKDKQHNNFHVRQYCDDHQFMNPIPKTDEYKYSDSNDEPIR
jgi:hypothetical protein